MVDYINLWYTQHNSINPQNSLNHRRFTLAAAYSKSLVQASPYLVSLYSVLLSYIMLYSYVYNTRDDKTRVFHNPSAEDEEKTTWECR